MRRLHELRHSLGGHPGLNQLALIASQRGRFPLVAYISLRADVRPDLVLAELQARAAPTTLHIEVLEQLPLIYGGKVDEKELQHRSDLL